MSGFMDELKGARSQMVEQRRRIAGSLARPYQRGSTENFWRIFVEIQVAIEAIDRASADEQTGCCCAAIASRQTTGPGVLVGRNVC
jgi:hypothetical protein